MANPTIEEINSVFQELIAKGFSGATGMKLPDITDVLNNKTQKSFSQQEVANGIETYRTSSSPKFDVQSGSGYWITEKS
jgi:hypothetical protein